MRLLPVDDAPTQPRFPTVGRLEHLEPRRPIHDRDARTQAARAWRGFGHAVSICAGV